MNKYEYVNTISKLARLEDLINRLNNYNDLTPEEEFEKERYKVVLRKLKRDKVAFERQNIPNW